MLHRKTIIPLALTLSAFWLCGCPGSQSNFSPSRSSASRVSTSKAPAAPSAAIPSPKHPPRDSAFSVYHNPDYGVSFRYPRNYFLKEEDVPKGSTLKTQEQLQAEQPGSILIATIEVPDDAYPNTTFVEGHLQFALDRHATPESCRSLVAPPDSDWLPAIDETTVQGILFYWRDRGSITPEAITYVSRDYAGFSGGTCYEFFLQIASTSAANSATPIAPADLAKILRPLEKTVSSLQVHNPSALVSHK